MSGVPGDGAHEVVMEAYSLHHDEIVRFLRSETRDHELAEDLAQEVFIAALIAEPRLHGDAASLLPWLYIVARRRYVDHLRRRLPDREWVPVKAAAHRLAPEPEYDADSIAVVFDAIRQLPATQQRVCLIRLIQGKSFAEIRDECGVSEHACRMCFKRARDALAEHLRSAGVALVPIVLAGPAGVTPPLTL